MSRKTSTYARKQRQLGGTYNGAEFLNTIMRSRGYTEEPMPEIGLRGTEDTAERARGRVKAAYVALTSGATPASNEENFDLMAHAFGVSCIRAGQIAGPEPESNPMLPPLIAGNAALRQVLNRRRKWGKWEVLKAEAEALDYAIEIYETILMASSPAQMAEACDLRMVALKGQTMETINPTSEKATD